MSEVHFGTGGFRGVISDDFTKENVQKICQAISNIINKQNLKKQICVGYDNRFMSEDFANWCAEVFAGNNIFVELMQTATSTPVVMYASKKNKNDFGVMITASHNPYMYNGIKVFTSEGKDASVETTQQIESEMQQTQSVKTKPLCDALNKEIVKVDYVEEFVDSIIKNQNIPLCENLNVVFDAKFGSTVSELHLLAKKLKIKKYTIINCVRDAFFGFVAPAPNENNIDQLKENIKLLGADIGFALDADGDRLAVVDKNGNYVDNNYILALVYYYLVKYENYKGDSVKNVATSNLLNVVTNKLGYVCHEVPVGFKYISSKLIEKNAVVGGESSGGLAMQNHIYGKDSLLSIALCLKIMQNLNKSFDEVMTELTSFANSYQKIIFDKQYSYTPSEGEKIKDMLFNQKQVAKHRYNLDKIVYDGYVKVYYQNGNWALVRFSGTEPVFRIFVEADTKQECEQMVKDWEQLLNL